MLISCKLSYELRVSRDKIVRAEFARDVKLMKLSGWKWSSSPGQPDGTFFKPYI